MHIVANIVGIILSIGAIAFCVRSMRDLKQLEAINQRDLAQVRAMKEALQHYLDDTK